MTNLLLQSRRLLIMAACGLSLPFITSSQLVSGNAFLKGNFVEVGIAPYGCWGTTVDAPAGYHARSNMNGDDPTFMKLGFVADPDKDGWTVGVNDKYEGDYFMAAEPHAGFSISIGSQNYYADRDVDGGSISGASTINAGSIMSVTSSADEMQAIWKTTVGALEMRKIVTVPLNGGFFTVRIVFVNNSSLPVNDVFYSDYVNPDNDAGYMDRRTINLDKTTRNAIVYQNPADNKALVSALGFLTDPQVYLGLGSKDCRAKVFRSTGSTVMVNATDVSASRQYTSPSFNQTQSGTDAGSFTNNYMGVVFSFGDIKAGDSVSATYAYVLTDADLDAALDKTDPVFLYKDKPYTSGSSIPFCDPGVLPVTLSNTDDLNWIWTANPALNATTGKEVTVTVTDAPVILSATALTPCGIKSIGVTISPDPIQAPGVSTPLALCQDAIPQQLTATGSNLLWFTDPLAAGDPVAPSPSTATPGSKSYYVTQESVNGCRSDMATILVNIGAATTASVSIDPAAANLCAGSFQTFTATTVNGGSGAAGQWQINGADVAGATNATFTYNQFADGDEVLLILTPGNICSTNATAASNAAVVKVLPMHTPAVSVQTSDAALSACAGEQVEFIATATDAGVDPQYAWVKNGADINGADAVTYKDKTLKDGDIITCRITSKETCVTSASAEAVPVTITISPLPDIAILKNNDINCKFPSATLVASGGDEYLWTPSTGLSDAAAATTIATPDGTTTYHVRVTNTTTGCFADKAVTVSVASKFNYLPNAFTPNGDGVNDCFGMVGGINVQELQLTVYTRAGAKVFTSNSSASCWDGNYKGEYMPSGVYVYTLEGTTLCGIVHEKGTVVLIR